MTTQRVGPWQTVACVYCKRVLCEDAECRPEGHPMRVEAQAQRDRAMAQGPGAIPPPSGL